MTTSLQKKTPSKLVGPGDRSQYLDVAEIISWKNAPCTGKYETLARDRDIFMIMFYCNILYADFKTLSKTALVTDPVVGSYLVRQQRKNDALALIQLSVFPDAMDLMVKYSSTDPRDPLFFSSDYFMGSEQAFNRRLQIIATDVLGWQRSVTAKMASVSNKQLFIQHGAAMIPVLEKLQRHLSKETLVSTGKTNDPVMYAMQGHAGEHTTRSYYEAGIREVTEMTKDLNFKTMFGI